MTDERYSPPAVAQRLLAVLVRHRDAEAIAGDLLEEYREVKRPALGAAWAGAWYTSQVLGLLGRLVWPLALVLVLARLGLAAFMLFPLAGGWNPSLVPAPNVSLLDALVFIAAGYAGARRTGRVVTGVVSAAALSLIDFALFTGVAVSLVPGLFQAIAAKPFILVIGTTFFAMAVVFAVTLGAVGAIIGRWHAGATAATGTA